MSAIVRAKFTVNQHIVTTWSKHQPGSTRVILNAVYDQTTEENRRFSKSTPSGTLEMTVDNPSAVEALELGKTFYIDFIPVD